MKRTSQEAWVKNFDNWCDKNMLGKAPESVISYIREAFVNPFTKLYNERRVLEEKNRRLIEDIDRLSTERAQLLIERDSLKKQLNLVER